MAANDQTKVVTARRRRKKVCILCAEKINVLDYKDIGKLKRFVSDRGKILPSRVSGSCAKHQRVVAKTIKRARNIGLIPYTLD